MNPAHDNAVTPKTRDTGRLLHEYGLTVDEASAKIKFFLQVKLGSNMSY